MPYCFLSLSQLELIGSFSRVSGIFFFLGIIELCTLSSFHITKMSAKMLKLSKGAFPYIPTWGIPLGPPLGINPDSLITLLISQEQTLAPGLRNALPQKHFVCYCYPVLIVLSTNYFYLFLFMYFND